MSHHHQSVKCWIQTSLLHQVLDESQLGFSTDIKNLTDQSDWGWVRAKLLKGDLHLRNPESEDEILIKVEDEDSQYDDLTASIPSKLFKDSKGNDSSYLNCPIIPANEFVDHKTLSIVLPPDDLITLTHLHEPGLVYSLRKRYEKDRIYTSTGAILLALNPFKNCDGLYDYAVMQQYWQKSEHGIDDDNVLPPHVYQNADCAFRTMMLGMELNKKEGSNQSILVSGESGAGKTVTTKHIMGYLATLSQHRSNEAEVDSILSNGHGNDKNFKRSKSLEAAAEIEQKILESNPLLESFGNARTIRNDNSSRFGKFIELQFNVYGLMIGASVETYLLEKVRLITQSEGERNYHIFYELLAGMENADRDQYFLKETESNRLYSAEDFNLLNQSGTYDRRDNVEDDDQHEKLIDALNTLGFTKKQRNEIFSVVCAILHMGNLTFREVTDDKSTIDKENSHLDPILNLMGLDFERMETVLCSHEIEAGVGMRKETHICSVRKDKAEKGMEALLKTLYWALFQYLVRTVNTVTTKTNKDGVGTGSMLRKSTRKMASSISVLDIFGFESFQNNSFEQLCINYCNEALQQQFNRFIFKAKEREYKQEGIAWNQIVFPDNQDVLDLIDKRMIGIIPICDDQCKTNGATDKKLAHAIYNAYKDPAINSRFEACYKLQGQNMFQINHYAGPVKYSIEGFLEKNKDELPKGSSSLLLSSKVDFVRTLANIIDESSFPGSPLGSPLGKRNLNRQGSMNGSPHGKRNLIRQGSMNGGFKSVGKQFISQLNDLRAKIDFTTPHYIRCLKPNNLLVADRFDCKMIMDQLRCAGVLEAIKVSRVGHPQVYFHATFVHRYSLLSNVQVKQAERQNCSQRELCNTIVKTLSSLRLRSNTFNDNNENMHESDSDNSDKFLSGIEIGRSKVFLKQFSFDQLEYLRLQKVKVSAILIQKNWRRFLAEAMLRKAIASAIVLQCYSRRNSATMKVQLLREERAALKIQCFWRMASVQRLYLSKKKVALWIQCMQRGSVDRKKYVGLNETRKATKIQTFWLACVASKRFQLKRRSALSIQCFFRVQKSRSILKGLKVESRNLNSIKEERDSLQRELRELKLRASHDASLRASTSSQNELSEYNEKLCVLKSAVNSVDTKTSPEKVLRLMNQVEELKLKLEESRAMIEDQKQEILSKEIQIEKLNTEIGTLCKETKEHTVSMTQKNLLPIATIETPVRNVTVSHTVPSKRGLMGCLFGTWADSFTLPAPSAAHPADIV